MSVVAYIAGQSLGERAHRITVAERQKPIGDVIAPFRDEVLHRAKLGFFSCNVELCEQHGPPSYFARPDIQNLIGDAFKAEGIAVSFGRVDPSTGYPPLFINWFKTRRVVRISRRVRLAKAEAIHKAARDAGAPIVKQTVPERKKKQEFIDEDDDFEEFTPPVKKPASPAPEVVITPDNKKDVETTTATTKADVDVHSEEGSSEEGEGGLKKPSRRDKAGIISPLKTTGSGMVDFIRARRTAENKSKKVSKGITAEEKAEKERLLIDEALKIVKHSKEQVE